MPAPGKTSRRDVLSCGAAVPLVGGLLTGRASEVAGRERHAPHRLDERHDVVLRAIDVVDRRAEVIALLRHRYCSSGRDSSNCD